MNVDYGAIGQRIKQVRRSRDMTQERLAEALSVSVGYISQIERLSLIHILKTNRNFCFCRMGTYYHHPQTKNRSTHN